MRTLSLRAIPLVLFAGVVLSACGNNNMCSLDGGGGNGGCPSEKVCEAVRGAMPMCFTPVKIRGKVFDITSRAALANARVTALDPNGAPASPTAVTDAAGVYTLQIPAERNADGTIASAQYTLRAEGDGYQNYPSGTRPGIPVDTSMATTANGMMTVENVTTDVGLIALAAGQRGSVEGRVEGSVKGGVLVTGGGATTVSAPEGTFTLFNVTAGAVTVRGFAAGTQLQPASATVTAGAVTRDVVLTTASAPLATISGSVQIVNAPGGAKTSVVLVLEDTFNVALERGEVPRGLRVGDVSGAFTLRDVPDGSYVVLAAYENDSLVRDPDPNISGTQIVHVTVPMNGSRAITLSDSFKVTEALEVIAPGKELPTAVTASPVQFQWKDDSSEDGYELRVYDALGNLACMNLDLPNVSGRDVTAECAGFTPTPGMYYQFRATSWRGRNGVHGPISRTEDLRGVFFAPAL